MCERYLKNLFIDTSNKTPITENVKIKDVFYFIDNRGKTPPLSNIETIHPIIDIRTLASNSRNIQYENATKFVDNNTYLSWFRSGHPQKYDILFSTVGTIGSMKIFNESKGCIAQNVVGLRCKNGFPLYYYQQLKSIQEDLISYDIGSVQPSIKISQIDKHLLKNISQDSMKNFEKTARIFTDKIFLLYKINTKLKKLKETYLKKFFS